MGKVVQEDRLLYEDKSGEYFLGTDSDLDATFIYIGAYGSIDNTIYFTPQSDPKAQITLIQEKIDVKLYYVEQKNGEFIIRVNDTHPNNRVVKVSVDHPGQENWQEL